MKALITGTNKGLGFAIAHKFKQSGFTVLGVGRSPESSCEWVDEYYSVDLADNQQLEEFAQKIKNIGITTLVNNAGVNKPEPFVEIEPKSFLSTQQINLYAPFRLCQAVLPNMIENRYGRIVNIASIWSKISRAGVASYSASKFGLDGMTLSLAVEHGKNHIMANCVSPGFVDTELTRTNLSPEKIAHYESLIPVGRMAEPKEIAELVYFLGSVNNTYITGQNISCDGGFARA